MSLPYDATSILQRDGAETEQYTVLGAWDSDPDKRIVSYMSEIGQALVGQKVGTRGTCALILAYVKDCPCGWSGAGYSFGPF